MELYCKKNGLVSIGAIIVLIGCLLYMTFRSMNIFSGEDDPVTFWVLMIIFGPILIIVYALIIYSIVFLIHDYKTLVIDRKPVAAYDDEVFKMYDPLVLKYRVFKWEDIQGFVGYNFNGMFKVQIKLKNPKQVFLYDYLSATKGLSFGTDMQYDEFWKFVDDLNKKAASYSQQSTL